MVRVSVLMSVFNGDKYLPEAIESILGQTFTDFEFLILDDGSTDATPTILRKYAAKDSRLRVISRENAGLVPSLNELLSYAQAQFIARMDADDIALPHRFSHQIQFLEDHADVVCVGGDVEAIDERGRFLTRIYYHKTNDKIQERLLSGSTHICHPAAMMRRDAVIRVGGYDSTYSLAEDLDLWLRLGEIGKLANLEEAILRYRFHGNSLSEQSRARQSEAARAACERAWQRRGIQGEFKSVAGWRPGPDRASRYQYALQYGWWAWKSHQRRTAGVYALRAIRQRPMARGGWGLLARVLCVPFFWASD